MATNKNQHFVPQCYLRQFAIEGTDRAINLYNIDRDKFVEYASIRDQCSKDYFYGEDARLEKAIKAVEDSYGAAVREIFQPDYLLTDEHRISLKLFWLLQHLRTEEASRRIVEMTDVMAPVVDPGDSGFRLQIGEAVQMAMRTFAKFIRVVSDLKVCLIRNRSGVPFVTSDDPAVFTNRWHLQNAKRRGLSFGLQSAGTLLILPLSPSVLCLAYDGDMYSVSHFRGWIDLRNDADADAFNQHQYLNCRANIFVKQTAHFEVIRGAFQRASKFRPPARHRMHYAILDTTNGEYSRYVVVDREKTEPHEKELLHVQVVHATPPVWPRQITWRTGASAFSNGTGIGYVRRAFTYRDDSRPFKKVRAFSS